MAAMNCWRCLMRPSLTAGPVSSRIVPIMLAPTAVALFSTSTLLGAKGSGLGRQEAYRSGKKRKFKSKRRTGALGRSPLPGERKAFRKRIMLSNNNALEVPGLRKLAPESMVQEESAGQVMAIPDDVVDQLRSSEAFKTTQCWGLFRSPHILVRSETVELTKKIQAVAADGKTSRLVISGDKLSGKSMLLLQSMANAFLNEWIVVNIPEGQDLTSASTEYAAIPGTDPVQWMQPNYALKMINTIHKSNTAVLSKLTTTKAWDNLIIPVAQGAKLTELSGMAREADTAWPIFQALWTELTVAGHGRPPLLFTLDGLCHVMRVSEYRNPSFEFIHSHDLHIVRTFVDLLSGKTALPNGGAVLAATSRSNTRRNPSLDLALQQRTAEQDGTDVPVHDPFLKGYDDRVDAALKSVEVKNLKGINRAEARSLLEYWAASGLLKAAVDERTVTEKWTLGGKGIVGEMERASLLSMRL